ncbi:MAG: hypothetical protein QOJ01_1410 [Solirubrobacterales bacterium]|jgi:uncharacterized protein YndB with AHSA1/START domain|nr:hypothetical protein [Solirubrobacterales bacterium]
MSEDRQVDEAREVRRETIVEADEADVWRAFTDPALLSEWLGDDAELDPVPGGEVSVGGPDGQREGRVLWVEEGRSLVFTWARPGDDESIVQLELEPCVSGTRVTVVESLTQAGALTPTAMAWGASLARLSHATSLALA